LVHEEALVVDGVQVDHDDHLGEDDEGDDHHEDEEVLEVLDEVVVEPVGSR
jgi:division protein CdvB (Snf7/Vps24/ESCRT-III family)